MQLYVFLQDLIGDRILNYIADNQGCVLWVVETDSHNPTLSTSSL